VSDPDNAHDPNWFRANPDGWKAPIVVALASPDECDHRAPYPERVSLSARQSIFSRSRQYFGVENALPQTVRALLRFHQSESAPAAIANL
jgi:hypothetical protein